MSKGGAGGHFRRGEPRAWWGRAKKEVGHLVVKNEWFEGCCDAGDVIDAEECIISITTGSQSVVAATLRVPVGLKRALPMWWGSGQEREKTAAGKR